MKIIFILLCCFIFSAGYSQEKLKYLEKNRYDLTKSNFEFPQKDFKLIGFGAYHGSSKTEEAEYALLKSLTKNVDIHYYLPETDFSIAHYFNEYLKTGDTLLLKDLVYHYGIRVPQEKTIETYKKWKKIKILNDSLPEDKKLLVVGIDAVVSYKYTSKHLLALIKTNQNKEKTLTKIEQMVKIDTTDFSPYYNSYSKSVLKDFVAEYEKYPSKFDNNIRNKFFFDHIIKNLKTSFNATTNREKIIFNNYIHLAGYYDFNQHSPFFRFGFGHLEKDSEGNSLSFVKMLIDHNVYKPNEILSIIGYLTKSRVLWDALYDDNGNYTSYTTEGGFGIGDYEKEYFLGIDRLKETKLSDITLFRLNKEGSPYNDGIPELIEVIMKDEKSNGDLVKGKSTTNFLDYAVLISNSKANTPIQEMN